RGGLGLHAGAKRLRVRDGDTGGGSAGGDGTARDGGPGGLRSVGQLFLGLSATGKTTLTCHGLGLSGSERAELVQDDVCALLPDGTVAGSEGGGLYIKTQGLSPDEQPELYRAATSEGAVLENVVVEPDGAVDFDDDSITSNGRASVRRDDLPGAAEGIDLEALDHVFFITRNRLMPPVSRLSPGEAAAAFMLGESIQTSAGDPDRAGESIRVVGTNPFVVGSPGEEGNRFLDLVRETGVECFLLNTGEVGYGEPRSVGVEESTAILEAIARDAIEWAPDDRLGVELPTRVRGVDVDAFYPPALVPDFDERLADLLAERRAYLEGFPDLDDEIFETALSGPIDRARTE
ncbi:MAG TPA: phosphoenolpyruvate carboxykinase, partial [Halobacteriales archaeon]|nr:phosphoenolpyruvate carboxykinase [Halobacteriales archaeon]